MMSTEALTRGSFKKVSCDGRLSGQSCSQKESPTSKNGPKFKLEVRTSCSHPANFDTFRVEFHVVWMDVRTMRRISAACNTPHPSIQPMAAR